MSRSAFPVDLGRADERRAGVFVLDADAMRRQLVAGLLAAQAELHVLGVHGGSIAAVALVVRALPHVCVIGPRVLAGPVPELVAALERALPATRCVRVPPVLGVDPVTLSPTQRERQVTDVGTFVRAVLAASGRPVAGVEAAVRAHLDRVRVRRVPRPG